MEHQKEQESFRYTYSAKEQDELKKIRQKYAPPEEDQMEHLRRLDQSAIRPGIIAALSVGIISLLILGVGMCCCMVWMGDWFIPGIILGIVGMAGAASAYPLYSHMTKKRRERLAPEIMRLTDELMLLNFMKK